MSICDPLLIRNRSAPSRVIFGPHETNLGTGRNFSSQHGAYYARRAAGGAGVIVLEEASVHPSDWPYERAPLASECGSAWGVVAGAIRSASPGAGAPLVLAALGHSGGQGTSHWNQRELWAPSAVPEVSTREVPKVMELTDIAAVIAGFATATVSAVACGLDGVEVNAGQFSLVRQFVSGLTNMRADEYGSDRLRFAREVLQAVRVAAGDAIVGLRLSCDELAPWAGIVPDAGVGIAVELAPYVDVVTVVRGSIYSAALTRPDGHVEPGFNIELTRQVRDGLRAAGFQLPVVAQGSIVDVGQADWALESGAADGIEMTRALLADARLVDLTRSGQSARIRPCVLCNQTCKVRDNRNPVITCVVDPLTGFEASDAADQPPNTIDMADGSGARVRVAGGGVAGLEVARVAALHGKQVVVHERSSAFGGALRAAAQGAGRGRLALVADWLEAECRELGVELVANSLVDTDAYAGGALVHVVATGGSPGPLPFAVDDGAVVHDAALLMQGIADGRPDELGPGPVAVWDPLGGPIAISVAELLAATGRAVVLITPDLLVGEKLALSGDLAPSQGRLHGAGVELVKRALVRRVLATGVEVEDRFTGVRTVIGANAFVAAHHRVPDTSVDPNENVLQVGDRVAPRTILEAIREGRAAGLAIAANVASHRG